MSKKKNGSKKHPGKKGAKAAPPDAKPMNFKGCWTASIDWDEQAAGVSAFEATGFTPSVNWYRNTDRNWHLLADADPVIQQPTLMIYGDRDSVPRAQNLTAFVPNAEEIGLDCGHWVQQEQPEETNQAILGWLARQDAAAAVPLHR